GSNNWVITGRRTTSGLPLVASDPHSAFEAVSCWYEAHLWGGRFQVAGMAYAGIPAIMFGRNQRVGWGITNNICSQRDLYQERSDPAHPGAFLYDDQWEPAREITEVIKVRGDASRTLNVRCSRNGPVVDDILPPAAQATGPVTLKWLGAYQGGWLTSLLGMDRASNITAFREALRPWHVPTFALVFADVEGGFGFQASGRVPLRNMSEHGYRPGWDPQHQWQGLIPFEAMPHLLNPERDWIASANNRLAPDDFPYPLSGCWNSGWRAIRIRQMIEAREQHSVDDMRHMQQDARSLRAVDHRPGILAALEDCSDPLLQQARAVLDDWDCDILPDAVAPTIFNVFFTNWCTAVAAERFEQPQIELVAAGIRSCAGRLLHADPAAWFAPGERIPRIRQTLLRTLADLSDRFGTDMTQWTWDRLHVMPLKHVLSERGDLAELLDHGGAGVRGDMWTVCNTGAGLDERAATGAGYRMIADMSTNPPKLLAVDGQSQSGHPGSPHYSDQYPDWLSGSYHEILLGPQADAAVTWTLEPEAE
ncbi:MAG: penicillin acylase family protein, partial [Planctomycetaceae bacterium]